MEQTKIVLEAKNLYRYFGSYAAVNNLSFEVSEKEILGIAGPNGSGKTTLMNIITQVIPPSSGEIIFNGKSIQDLQAFNICHLGIARTYQQPMIFGTLSVIDNLLVGLTFGKKMTKTETNKEEVMEILQFVGLDQKKDLVAEKLIVNDKKKLMIAIALATDPHLLILDEPCAGLTTIESKGIIHLIEKINQRGVTVILIEHNMQVLMNISHRVMIIDQGSKMCEGTPEFVYNNEQVIEKYLGRKKKKGVSL